MVPFYRYKVNIHTIYLKLVKSPGKARKLLASRDCLSYFNKVSTMKIKQKIIALLTVITSTITISGLVSVPTYAAQCGGVETSIVSCPQTGDGESAKNSGVWGVLLIALNIMTAGIGILAVGGIVYGAILYASAAENAKQIQEAKDIIKNVVIGLLAYGAMYMLLNFLIPGGIFT